MGILREKGWGGVKGGEIKSAAGRDCGGSGRGGGAGEGGGEVIRTVARDPCFGGHRIAES